MSGVIVRVCVCVDLEEKCIAIECVCVCVSVRVRENFVVSPKANIQRGAFPAYFVSGKALSDAEPNPILFF